MSICSDSITIPSEHAGPALVVREPKRQVGDDVSWAVFHGRRSAARSLGARFTGISILAIEQDKYKKEKATSPRKAA
jgi:hypothetical protein